METLQSIKVSEDAILEILRTHSYNTADGFGLTNLEIANHMGVQRDCVSTKTAVMAREGSIMNTGSRRSVSNVPNIVYRIPTASQEKRVMSLKAGATSTTSGKADKRTPLKERVKELMTFTNCIKQKCVIEDPLEDLDAVWRRMCDLFPELM